MLIPFLCGVGPFFLIFIFLTKELYNGRFRFKKGQLIKFYKPKNKLSQIGIGPLVREINCLENFSKTLKGTGFILKRIKYLETTQEFQTYKILDFKTGKEFWVDIKFLTPAEKRKKNKWLSKKEI